MPAGDEVSEHRCRIFPGPHPQGQVCVVRVRGAVGGAEPVHRGQFDLGGRPFRDHVQDAAAADGGQLPPVPDEHHAGVGFVSNVQQSAGGFLIEHAGFVDDEDDVTVAQFGVLAWSSVHGPGERVGVPGL